jgi:hypothetical protein
MPKRANVKKNFLGLLDSNGELRLSTSNPFDPTPLYHKYDRTVTNKDRDQCTGTVTSPLGIPLCEGGSDRWRLWLLKHNSRLLNGKKEQLCGVSGRNMCEFDASFTYVDSEGKKFRCIGVGIYKDRHNSKARLHHLLTRGKYHPKKLRGGRTLIPDKRILALLRAELKSSEAAPLQGARPADTKGLARTDAIKHSRASEPGVPVASALTKATGAARGPPKRPPKKRVRFSKPEVPVLENVAKGASPPERRVSIASLLAQFKDANTSSSKRSPNKSLRFSKREVRKLVEGTLVQDIEDNRSPKKKLRFAHQHGELDLPFSPIHEMNMYGLSQLPSWEDFERVEMYDPSFTSDLSTSAFLTQELNELPVQV